MKLILYANSSEETGDKLEKLIQDQLPDIQIGHLNSIEGLSRCLCRPLNRISVIIIYIFCEKDIDQLLRLMPLFDNIRLILVLPDRTEGMMASGLKLNPCFISYSDNDFSDVTSVLKKINHRTKGA